jgi:hypothetical protein
MSTGRWLPGFWRLLLVPPSGSGRPRRVSVLENVGIFCVEG